jgi:cellulose synthase/poly-beta-1,6-N-acetylglucosamine synthase-like glycosyltransferase
MKKYLKLVNFEFNRIAKLFAVLLGITLVTQIVGVIVVSKDYLNMANEKIYDELMTKAQFLENFGQMSFLQIVRSAWFVGPIALCIAGVAFYIFLIWYRDWVGKNTFIYRLLMLPTTRLNIFFAKITTIMIMTFGLVAFQLILLPIEMLVMKAMVPNEFRADMSVIEIVTSIPELSIIIPGSILELILFYGAGLLGVSILFTGILMERSFRWKGIFAGLIYSALAVVILISPLLLQEFVLNGYFYPAELLVLEIVMGLMVLAASIWMSGFLLRKKITV